jgi:adenylate cyclase
MTDIVFENSGIIDKYIGDAILAEFGAPVFNEKHPDLAVSTAISMQKELLRLNNDWKNLYGTSIKARVGINTVR